METIAHAAILNRKIRCIIFGKDHDECVRRSIKVFSFIYDYPTNEKGFLTSKMRFVSQQEAMEVAITAGQVSKSIRDRTLFSGCFFDKNEGGIHIYDSVLGYTLPVCSGNSPENKK